MARHRELRRVLNLEPAHVVFLSDAVVMKSLRASYTLAMREVGSPRRMPRQRRLYGISARANNVHHGAGVDSVADAAASSLRRTCLVSPGARPRDRPRLRSNGDGDVMASARGASGYQRAASITA